MKKINNYINLLKESLSILEKDESKVNDIAKYIKFCNKKNLKVLVAGNGGSCADAEQREPCCVTCCKRCCFVATKCKS